ncbi:hypothetical protein ERX46_05375 [Brumimicrobium glaciale]|uniref:Uncharacterized protein n=1 Tax=Brumimicrobium glaciale TaxID=200475 RepID=A0A4V1WFY4_9FLAO|nr:hypothetical protein [Brumimicrobium glaciale]RYM34806.1 hypothetical protein ERX46_05375 [Brumimicrobium glaciale]
MHYFSSTKRDLFRYNNELPISLYGNVFFIDNGQQEEVVNFIKANYDEIKRVFRTDYKRFILLSDIKFKDGFLDTLRYYYPKLPSVSHVNDLSFEVVKNYLGYKGNIKTGLLSIDDECEFIEFETDSVAKFKQLYIGFIKYHRIYIEDELPCFGGEYVNNKDDLIALDDETKEAVEIIFKQFLSLRENGSFLQVLPLLENYVQDVKIQDLKGLSMLKVDNEYNILLVDYNLEIKLSHLTKSLYLLFLNHSEGILLSELSKHRDELFELYQSISNRVDFGKMNESIDDLINLKSNAIYVHLSRIKSAFIKVVIEHIAENYFIDGGKNMPKRIKLTKELIDWDSKF